MKAETLETLLLDRALGELPPEVAELLDEHLAQNAAAAQQAETLAATLRLTRQAVAGPLEAPRRLPPWEKLRRAQQRQRWRVRAWEATRLAACVALGLTLGWLGHAPRSAQTPMLAQTPVVAAPEVTTAPAETPVRFWSMARLSEAQRARLAPTAEPADRYRLQWDSPVKMPRVEENKL
jgi:anti-sigma factor RsiW